MSEPTPNPPKIFISYARKDAKWKDELKTHLKPLLRGGSLSEWDDTQIKIGSIGDSEIKKALAEADMGVLLVTPSFLASDYIHDNELIPLLAKENLVWIAVSASTFEYTPFKDIQCANDPAKPVDTNTRAKRNAVWVDLCKKIVALLENPH